MKVSRGESEEFKARRMASYEYVNQKREEERWVRTTYFSADVSYANIRSSYEHQRILAKSTVFLKCLRSDSRWKALMRFFHFTFQGKPQS